MESIQIAKISASSIVVYNKFLEAPPRSARQKENESNLRDQEYNGFMSPKTKQKVRKMLDTWLTSVEIRRRELGQGNYYRNSKVTFVTLTLSGKQVHSDNDIKRKMLNRFIVELRREKGVCHYFWRAEPQKNGNIHFHILIDKYIHWREIRNKWNGIQEDNGYLDNFRAKFMHIDANSTDIHGLGKVKNLTAYVVKYCCKTKGERKIDGRIWGSSDSLRNITCYEGFYDDGIREYIEQVTKEKNVKVVVKDDFTLILCDNEKYLKKYSQFHYKEFKNHYRSIFDSLYSEEGRRLARETMEKKKIVATYRAPINSRSIEKRSSALGSSQLALFAPSNMVHSR